MKRFVFKPGLLLQARSDDSRLGYICALHRDPAFGTLFRVVTQPFEAAFRPPSLHDVLDAPWEPAYVNTAYGLRSGPSAPESWRRVGQLPVEFSRPTFYFGSELTMMTIAHPDGRQDYVAGPLDLPTFEDAMALRGFYPKVLWLPSAIAARIFPQRPLRWSAHRTY